MKLNMDVRKVIFTGLIFAVSVGSWGLIFRPRNRANAAINRDLRQKQSMLKELDLSRDLATRHLKQDIRELDKVVETMNSRLPDEEQTDKIIHELSGLAQASRMRIKSIETPRKKPSKSAGQDDKIEKYARQEITITMEGDFADFYAFLQAMEAQKRIFHVINMKLESLESQSAESGQIKAFLQLEMVFRHRPVKGKS